MLPTRYWQDLPWPAFRDLPANTVAVLPVASIEQHGPHLPVSVDTTINQGVVARTLKVLPAEVPVLVLPTQCVGNSVEHLRFPGTLTTTPETLLTLVTDIGASVARAGVKRLVLVNSHGGNVSVLDIAARRLRILHDLFVVNAMWARMGKPESQRDPVESTYGIHAGRDETAVLLALRPDLVQMDKARNFVSRWQGASNRAPRIAPTAGAPLAWQAQDLNPAGAVGDASAATAAQGEEILDFAAEKMAALWSEVAAFDVESWLANEPNPDA
ncbi:creatininase [Falsiroseomonas bella]|uniref:Creatininase n=1 Tax=Falsiroseomonas bella TaxID=2184016 RepID=A0A317F5Z3_9PROT|nr:creatininase family protein [Falsiroseomonas bella]PWS34600.1 creatininase [Falsiroseomonas bella]